LWRRWFTTTKITSLDFDISIEFKESHGCFHQIVLTRVEHSKDILYRSIPFSTIMEKYVKIPDLMYYVNRRMTGKLSSLPWLVIPKVVVQKMRNFASRQLDEKYHWTSFATVASGTQ